jgi:hypothetical protein
VCTGASPSEAAPDRAGDARCDPRLDDTEVTIDLVAVDGSLFEAEPRDGEEALHQLGRAHRLGRRAGRARPGELGVQPHPRRAVEASLGERERE